MKLIVEFFICLAIFLINCQAKSGPKYNDYKSCQKPNQSPISIPSSEFSIQFAWGKLKDPRIAKLHNHRLSGTVRIQTEYNDETRDFDKFDQFVTFEESEYRLKHIDFHWGEKNTVGSLHTIDGFGYDGEIQFEHLMDGEAENLVVSVFLKEDDDVKDIHEINLIKNALDQIKEFNGWTLLAGSADEIFSLRSFKTGVDFYHYIGTTIDTPCNSGAVRIVLKEPLRVSGEFFDKLRLLKDDDGTLRLKSANRGVQPLGTRKVTKNF